MMANTHTSPPKDNVFETSCDIGYCLLAYRMQQILKVELLNRKIIGFADQLLSMLNVNPNGCLNRKYSTPESWRTLKRVSELTRFSPAVRIRGVPRSLSSRFQSRVFDSKFRTTQVRRASSPSYTCSGCRMLSRKLGKAKKIKSLENQIHLTRVDCHRGNVCMFKRILPMANMMVELITIKRWMYILLVPEEVKRTGPYINDKYKESVSLIVIKYDDLITLKQVL